MDALEKWMIIQFKYVPQPFDDLLHSLLSLSFIQMGRCAMHKCKAVVKKKKKMGALLGSIQTNF